MKSTVTTLAAVVAITLGTSAIQARQETPKQKISPPEVTLTGCVIQGATPTEFFLDNAKKDPASTEEKGVKYLLATTAEDIDLRKHLNHEVRVVGEVDLKVVSTTPAMPPTPPTTVPPDPQRPVVEKNLPKLSAKNVTMVSDTCAMTR